MKKTYISPTVTVYTLCTNDGILTTKSNLKVTVTTTDDTKKITTENEFLGREKESDLDKNYQEWDSGW